MRVVFLHGHMFNAHNWLRAQEMLRADGIELHFFSQLQSAAESLEFLRNNKVELIIAQLFHDLPYAAELGAAAATCTHRMGLGVELLADFTTFSAQEGQVFARYLSQVAAENYANGIRYLVSCSGAKIDYAPFASLTLPAIFHPQAAELFLSVAAYFSWTRQQGKSPGQVVGILVYYGQIAEDNHADTDALILALEQHGFTPLCVAVEDMADSSLPFDLRYPWLPCIEEAGAEILLNLLAGRLLVDPEDDQILRSLNIPVVQLIRLHHQSPEEWRQDSDGLGAAQSMVFNVQQPEMVGAIEPLAVAAALAGCENSIGLPVRRYVPLDENIELLCRRIRRWLRLRQLPNAEKRLVIVLHNNPCKGVEATLGLAAGLDTFVSLGNCIRALRLAGYDTGDAPEDGRQLLDLFLERKAISEFRWTTVDEIVAKGGVLHRVDRAEYEQILAAMPRAARESVQADWGDFPGEGMVFHEHGEDFLLVTGLVFGKLRLMLQPKRGCYGAKCNGEVCRILHEPRLSPPPHWLATYAYIREQADAVLHFGAHGSLEFLPGKQIALSPACFPLVSLDDLPNIYLYILDVPGEAMIAKRRGAAVLVSHLPPVRRPVPADEAYIRMAELAEQYQRAQEQGELARANLLQVALIPLLQKHGLSKDEESFTESLGLLSRRLRRAGQDAVSVVLHRLGHVPDLEDRAIMLATMLGHTGRDKALPSLEEIASWHPSGLPIFAAAVTVLAEIIRNEQQAEPPVLAGAQSYAALARWCRKTDALLQASCREIPQLLGALNGEFIEAGLSGSLLLGKTEALPTGRNLFAVDVRALPTQAAWKRGQELADRLLRKYLQDEAHFPESVGVSLWSIDAFKSDGEVFCQILYLMGMQPQWAGNGQVTGVCPLPLEELVLKQALEKGGSIRRPRVDVLIQTSSILRDMVPHFATLLDEAAVMAGELDEPEEWNYIRKHILESMHSLRADLQEQFTESDLHRLVSFRVFSSAFGCYGGAEVGLALDASAWENEEDLAEIHVNGHGFAYGAPGQNMQAAMGRAAHQLYARALQKLDVTYMRQYSPEYDLLDSSCYSSALGGMAVAAKAMRGTATRVYWGESSLVKEAEVLDLQEEISRLASAKLLNREWIALQREQGYQAAAAIAAKINTLFRWSATTGSVEGWVFNQVVEHYLKDEQTFIWLREQNPYALEEISRRLLEAEARGLWQAGSHLLASVQQAALALEGDMEEQMGEVEGDFQGGKVEIIGVDKVDKWQLNWRLPNKSRGGSEEPV